MTKLRVAVIGVGNWGRNHARTVAGLPDVELSAICDVDRAKLEVVGRRYPGVPLVATADEAFDHADAVVIATPASEHAELTARAIGRGLPALVEKPFALSSETAIQVAQLADSNKVPVVVGHLLVFHSAVERLKQMLQVGELGTPYYLYSQRVNLGQVRPDENALWSFGPHDISVALELLGETPVRVTAHGKSYLQPGIEDVVFMTMEFASGVMAHVQMSWLDPRKERRLTVVGSRKMVVFDDMEAREKLRIYDKGVDRPPEYTSYGESLAIREGDITIPRVPNVEPLSAELRHFVQVARGEVEPRVNAWDGVIVVRILEAATESMANGGVGVGIASTDRAGAP
ncbi:MAG: Gfo/Idh/MocA family oxidoreductase [Gemmatimonadota bacterium]|nr:Gfo/Idh/MocA family oxidoreductase [Gemmatimonadota bacterium]